MIEVPRFCERTLLSNDSDLLNPVKGGLLHEQQYSVTKRLDRCAKGPQDPPERILLGEFLFFNWMGKTMNKRLVTTAGAISIAFSALSLTSASAATITDASVTAVRDNETFNSVGTGEGDNFSIAAFNVEPDATQGTTATAQNVVTGTTVNLPDRASEGRPGLFGVEFSYQDALAQNLLGTWTITLNNGPDTLVLNTPDATSLQEMETVNKLSVIGDATSPTVFWELPTEGPPVTQVRYEVWDDDTNTILTGQNAVDLGARAVSLQLSDLTLGTTYAVRVIALNQDNAATTRSSNWISWSPGEASPSGNVAKLTTGSPASISQLVDVPDDPFTLSFDYRFLTDTGSLSLTLGRQPIGIELDTLFDIPTGFSRAFFEIDIEDLLGESGVPLTFLLDGPTGSSVLLDNIMFPGLVSGGFEDLSAWETGGPGSVTLAAVPIPASLPLMIGALAMLGCGFRIRRGLTS